MTVRGGSLLPFAGLLIAICLHGCASSPANESTIANEPEKGGQQELVHQEPTPAHQIVELLPVPREANAEVAPPSPAAKPEVGPVPKLAKEVEPKPAANAEITSGSQHKIKTVPRTPPVIKDDPSPVAVKPIQTPQAAIPAKVEILELPAEPPPEMPKIEPESVAVTIESLPITIHNEWVLSAVGDICSLSTLPIAFDDGQGMSKLQLVFTAQHWLIKTQSDIDLSYSGTGLTVDEGRLFPLEQLVRESDLIFTREYAALTQAFIVGRRLHITLGFWPTWPVTETKTVTISLVNFASAHRAWKQCLSLING